MKHLSLSVLTVLLICGCTPEKVSAPPPYGAIPSDQQVVWQQMEYYMFIHFGPNTFTGKEWGSGREEPRVFNPTELDAEQWARTARAAGMKGIIITAKHHDGFCLWPSQYSTHTVRESPWKQGEGDVLKELSEACKKHGLRFGVYLSPWDRNHPEYGTPEYNQVFAGMLDEVLSNYGEVFEVWFDGANGEGPNGKKQVYDWDLFHRTVYKHHPEAIIFSDVGPGCRWIGNENGFAGTTNWSTLDTKGFEPGAGAPPRQSLNQGDMGAGQWVPGEADVSIRPGWFYSPETDHEVKSLNQLLEIYYASVGRNSNLLLNVPVSRKGLIHPNDSARLMALRRVLDETFDENIAAGKNISASDTRGNDPQFDVRNLLDEDYETYWATGDTVRSASFTIDLGEETAFNRLVLQEYIPLGQRVKSFGVEIWDGQAFTRLAEHTTIGYKRILVFPMIETSRVRINITDALASPVLSEFRLYKAPEMLSTPQITRNREGMVNITSVSPDPVIVYTTDGTEPAFSSRRFTAPFPFSDGGVIKAKAFTHDGRQASETFSAVYDVSPAGWTVVATDSEMRGAEGSKAIDADPATAWRTNPREAAFPHEIIIDLGASLQLKGFTYTPVREGDRDGTINRYNFYVSSDGKNWKKVISNRRFANIKNNPVKQEVAFDKPCNGRYIKFQGLSAVNADQPAVSAGEIGILTR